MKKWFLISAMVLVGALMMPGTAAAQIGDGRTGGCDAAYYVCDDGVWGDPGAWGSGYYAGAFADCKDDWGCLNCTLSEDRTHALCGRVWMQNGWCDCTPIGVEIRYGQPHPVCKHPGWCTYRR